MSPTSRPAAMTTVALAVAWGACSSSSPIKKTSTDASSDSAPNIAKVDAAPDSPAVASDVATSTADQARAAEDGAGALTIDALAGKDGALVDLAIARDSTAKDGAISDVPLPLEAASADVVRPEVAPEIAPRSDVAMSDADQALCQGDYTACGCGCCGATARDIVCYYPTAGDSLDAIRASDEQAKNNPSCASAGCNAGTRYVCCVPAAPEPVSSASYTASASSTSVDRLTISKSGNDCATMSFTNPTRESWRMDVPKGWGTSSASFGTCGGTAEQANGAIGTLALRTANGQCVADLHVTLFAPDSSGDVETARMDIDGLAIGEADFCR